MTEDNQNSAEASLSPQVDPSDDPEDAEVYPETTDASQDDEIADPNEDMDEDDATAAEMRAAMGFASFGGGMNPKSSTQDGPPGKKRKYDRFDAVVDGAAPPAVQSRGTGANATVVTAAPRTTDRSSQPHPARPGAGPGSRVMPVSAPLVESGSGGRREERAAHYFKPSFLEDPWAPLLASARGDTSRGAG